MCTHWLFVHARTVREGAHHDPGRRRNNCVVLNSSYQVCDVRAESWADDRTATSSMERTGKQACDLRCTRPGSIAERALDRSAHVAVICPPIRVSVNRITSAVTGRRREIFHFPTMRLRRSRARLCYSQLLTLRHPFSNRSWQYLATIGASHARIRGVDKCTKFGTAIAGNVGKNAS